MKRIDIAIGNCPGIGTDLCHGESGLPRADHRRAPGCGYGIDDAARIDGCPFPGTVAAVATAHFAGTRLDPVGVHLERPALGVQHGKGHRRIGRDIDLEGSVRFDDGIAEDLALFEIGVADGLTHARRGSRRSHRPDGADEAHRRTEIGRIGRVLQGQDVRHGRARILRIEGRRLGNHGIDRSRQGAAGAGALGRDICLRQHALSHAPQQIRVKDAGNRQGSHVLGSQGGTGHG